MSKGKHFLKKEEVLRFIKGQQAAAKVIEREQIEKLPHLTEDESREEYSHLCAIWRDSPKTGDMEALFFEQIAELVARQHRFARAALANQRQS